MAIPEGLNQKIAKQSMRGKKWNENDQHRYDIATGAKMGQRQTKELRQNTEGGVRKDYAAMQQKEADGVEFTKRSQNIYNRMGKRVEKIDARQAAKSRAQSVQGSSGKPTNAIDNTVTGQNDSAPSNMDVKIRNEQEQNVNQDNDINTTVNGNNNTVISEQDNSIRQYGGDNRSFVYNGQGNGADSPVSAATMSGFYDVDDSPAAQAQFNDMYTTMNRDNQKRYAGEAMKTYAKYGNIDARSYTDESMENTLNRGIQYSFDRSDAQTGHVFGDIWNDNYFYEDWKMPKPPSEIKSETADIAEKAKEDIEDM